MLRDTQVLDGVQNMELGVRFILLELKLIAFLYSMVHGAPW